MKRHLFHNLLSWKSNPGRKPILMRGARQVGKTHLVRQLGTTFHHFAEINFERDKGFAAVFEQDLNPKRMIRDISIALAQDIIPGETLLFLDEVQEAPQVITALRYFYEEMPELHVIAAGSLLDFAIEKIGVPVGRVEYRYLHPMSFIEFLCASGEQRLAKEIVTHPVNIPIGELLHRKALDRWGHYMAIGGFPQVVGEWINSQNVQKCQMHLNAIENTYIDDFGKYAKKHQIKYLDILFKKIPRVISKPFKFTAISDSFRKRELDPALQLFHKAGLVHYVYNSYGNGTPLNAEADFGKFKLIFVDCGLTQAINGVDLKEWFLNNQKAFINKGELTEAFVGQEMLAYSDPSAKKDLYYWENNKKGSNAEVDYLIGQENRIIPIEVKSGKGSQLQSIRQFLTSRKQTPYGIRFSIHDFSVFDNLHSYPIYAVANACNADLMAFIEGD